MVEQKTGAFGPGTFTGDLNGCLIWFVLLGLFVAGSTLTVYLGV